MNECRKFSIEGKVQGVWFRESTRQQAVRLGLKGHALNRTDGSVEVLACGEADALDRLHRWLQHGPPLAQVRSVSVDDCDETCPDGFSTG